jgi:hypothetical protein
MSGAALAPAFDERQVMTTITIRGEEPDRGVVRPPAPTAFVEFDSPMLRTSEDAIRLTSCRQFETIAVNTRRSVYEIVVLDGRTGDILVRGGSDFPEFRRVMFVGSTAGGSAIKLNTIDIGLRMELRVGDETVITSPVSAIVRTHQAGQESSLG